MQSGHLGQSSPQASPRSSTCGRPILQRRPDNSPFPSPSHCGASTLVPLRGGACIYSAWVDLGTTEEEMLSLLREGCERQYNLSLVLSGCSLLEPSHATGKKPTHPARAHDEQELKVLVHSPQPSSQLTAWSNLPDRCELYFHMPQIDPLLHCWWECKWAQPRWRTAQGLLKKLKTELPYDLAIPLLGI